MSKAIREERTIFCSGTNWEGDGSKATSACKFEDSMKTTAERYKCSHCATGQTPEGISAGANDIKKSEPKKALENEPQVQESTSVEIPEPVESTLDRTSVESTVVEEPLAVVTQSDSPPKKKAKIAKKKRRRF